MKKALSFFLSMVVAGTSLAQKPDASIDVLHYQFSVKLSDRSDRVEGEAQVKFNVLKETGTVNLDLTPVGADGKGMAVSMVKEVTPVRFSHDEIGLHLQFEHALAPGTEHTVTITYGGIPRDGLIIGPNKYGKRGFFADHWPLRAQNWLPCVDHPADKATLTFIITAPQHYQVVANGKLTEESNMPDGNKLTRYDEKVPLPTKVMVIGVADFAVQEAGVVNCVPIQSWVYAEDREKGFHDYADAVDVLPFFNERIAPFAYPKLANVQSKTRYGGLENAGAIFYFENSVTGEGKMPSLLSHEIAHQWFGDMASEKEWAHVWLSEGFATYMSDLYMEHRFGRDTLLSLLRTQRAEVIAFSKKNQRPIVDSAATDPMILLNANSYQKAGWVLHMMHEQMGDELFWKTVKAYYARYGGSNASTEDFQKVVEEHTGQDWSAFFHQWFYTPGQPDLDIRWKYGKGKKTLVLEIRQKQPVPFRFPFELEWKDAQGQSDLLKFDITERSTIRTIPVSSAIRQILPDPGTKTLAAFTVTAE